MPKGYVRDQKSSTCKSLMDISFLFIISNNEDYLTVVAYSENVLQREKLMIDSKLH
jgi:hypothetical protein